MQSGFVTLPEDFFKMSMGISVEFGVGSSLGGPSKFIRDFFPQGVSKDE